MSCLTYILELADVEEMEKRGQGVEGRDRSGGRGKSKGKREEWREEWG